MTHASRYLDPGLVERLNQLRLAARSVVEGTTLGLHRSQLKGASVEFRQHRAYVPGDEPRRLDWRVFARTDRPFIKEYDEETNLRCLLMFDSSGSMGYANKFEFAARLAAALAYLMLGATESVGLALLGDRLTQWLPPRSGSKQLSRITDGLDRSMPRGPIDWKKSTNEAAAKLGRRALVIMISDFFSPVPAIGNALSRFRHDRHELICLRVLHPDEQTFPFDKWSRFRGLEGEKPYRCEPTLMRQTYLQNFEKHRRELQCAMRGASAEFHEFVTDRPLVDSLTQFLRLRSSR